MKREKKTQETISDRVLGEIYKSWIWNTINENKKHAVSANQDAKDTFWSQRYDGYYHLQDGRQR